VNGFGDFANIDVEKVLRDAQGRQARIQEMQASMAELVGHATDETGLVSATFTPSGGLTELEIKPRALAQGSQDLAATVKQVIQDAGADLQQKMRAIMTEAFPDHESALDKDAAMAKAEEAQDAFNRVMTDGMAELEKIRKRMGL
jgi:DNA-binding protein YbaB